MGLTATGAGEAESLAAKNQPEKSEGSTEDPL
jgi:hypothetical protein